MSLSRFVLLIGATLLLCLEAFGQGMTLPPVTRTELDNGVVLILSEKHDVPLIGVRAAILGGATSDPEDRAGLASLLAGMLEKGAGDRDAAAFADAIAAVGGELSAQGGREAITVSAEFLARDADLLVELLADMLQRPALEASEMQKLRDRSINLIRAAKDSSLGALVPRYGSAFLFGDHPYGRPAGGSEESLGKISHKDLLAYYNDHVGADRLVIAVVGDFETAGMQEKLTTAFGEWRKAGVEPIEVVAAEPQRGNRVLLVDKPGATQTYFWLANVGVAIDYPQRAELNIANTVFGGRFTSMLMTELRIKAGLTYGARSILRRPSRSGSVVISSFTETSTTVEAIDLALDVLEQLRDSGLDDDMVLSARNYIMGQFPPRLETASQIAAQFAMLEHYGLDIAYINEYGAALEAASRDSITAVIEEVYPLPEDLTFILIGDAALIREDVSQYGPVKEVSIDAPQFRQ